MARRTRLVCVCVRARVCVFELCACAYRSLTEGCACVVVCVVVCGGGVCGGVCGSVWWQCVVVVCVVMCVCVCVAVCGACAQCARVFALLHVCVWGGVVVCVFVRCAWHAHVHVFVWEREGGI